MWSNQVETLGCNAAHSLPLMPFGSKKKKKIVVPIIGQTHPKTPWYINTESNMLVVQRPLE